MRHVLHAGRLHSKNSGVSVPYKDITHIFWRADYNNTVERKQFRIKREDVLQFTTGLCMGWRTEESYYDSRQGK